MDEHRDYTYRASTLEVELRPLTSRDLAAVVRIHMHVFPRYRSTLLGYSYVKAAYRWFTQAPQAFGFTACCGGEVVGFVTGTAGNYHRSQAKMLWPWLLLALLRRPWLLWHQSMLFALWFRLRNVLLGERTRSLTESGPPVPMAVLLSIGVAPQFQGKGIAGGLIAVFEGEAIRRGFRRMRLSVFKENTSAHRAYEKAGWRREEAPELGGILYIKEISA